MEELIKVSEWIDEKTIEPISENVTWFHQEFGKVKMRDGRLAQVQVHLELDEDDWY